MHLPKKSIYAYIVKGFGFPLLVLMFYKKLFLKSTSCLMPSIFVKVNILSL